MWPLLICSIAALAFAVERSLFILREATSRDRGSVDAIFRAIEKGELQKAVETGRNSKDPVARVLTYALQNRDGSLTNAVTRAANIELKRYARGLSVLDTIITLAPLLGLLGTVTGMISAFGLLGGSELDAPTAITGGIAEALIATAFGLGIAIVSLIPFNFLNSYLEDFRHELEDRGTQMEILLVGEGTPLVKRAPQEAA